MFFFASFLIKKISYAIAKISCKYLIVTQNVFIFWKIGGLELFLNNILL